MSIVVGHDISGSTIPFEASYADMLARLPRGGYSNGNIINANVAQRGIRGGSGLEAMRQHPGGANSSYAGFDWNGDKNGGDALGEWSATPEPQYSSGPQLAGSAEVQRVNDAARDYEPYNWAEAKDLGESIRAHDNALSTQDRIDQRARQREVDREGNKLYGVTPEGDAMDKQYQKDTDAYKLNTEREKQAENAGPLARLKMDNQQDDFVDKGSNIDYPEEFQKERDTLIRRMAEGLRHPSSDDPGVRANFLEAINKELQKNDEAARTVLAHTAADRKREEETAARQAATQAAVDERLKKREAFAEEQRIAREDAAKAESDRKEEVRQHRDRSSQNWTKAVDWIDNHPVPEDQREGKIQSRFNELQRGNPAPEEKRQKIEPHPLQQVSVETPQQEQQVASLYLKYKAEGKTLAEANDLVAQDLGVA